MRAMLLRSCVTTLITLGSVHCGGPDPIVVAPSPSGVPASATATSTPDATPSAVASASATSGALPSQPSPFEAVAPLEGAGRFFDVDGALLVSWVQPEGPGYGVRAIVDGQLGSETLTLGIGTFNFLVGITGTYPGALSAVVIGDTGRTGIAQHFVQSRNDWTLKAGTEGYVFAGYARTKDALLALRTPSMPWGNMRTEIQALRGATGSRKLTPVDKGRCKTEPGDPFAPTTLLRPTAFGGTGAGALFAFGTRCDGVPAVEVWPAGDKTSTVTESPGGVELEWNFASFATNDGDTAGALGGDKVLFFDGKAWSVVENAPALVRGALAADGTLWGVVDRGPLYKGDGKRGFEEVRVPGDAAVDDVGIASDGSVWISAGNALLSTSAPTGGGKPIEVAKASSGRDTKRKGPPTFGGPKCKSNVVVLYGFTKVTPDDYDFPLTRKALKGRTEFGKTRFVVTKDNGQKFFSALVPSFDEGKKLVALIENKVQGSKPQIVCAEPEIVRELKLDLATGEVAK